MRVDFFSPQILPTGFVFPRAYLSYIDQKNIPDLMPWWFLCEMKGMSDSWFKNIQKQYPNRKLVPFAKIDHTDDVACFDASVSSTDPIVHYVHAYASPGWEDRGNVTNFNAWLNAAISESERYKAE